MTDNGHRKMPVAVFKRVFQPPSGGFFVPQRFFYKGALIKLPLDCSGLFLCTER